MFWLKQNFISLVLLTRSELRFPSRRVRVAAASVLSVFGVTSCGGIRSVLVSAPFLCLVSSGVLLVLCSPFGLSLDSFGTLSSGVSGSFLQRFLFLLVRVAFTLLLALPWCLSSVTAFGLCFVFDSTLFCVCSSPPLFSLWFSLPSLDILHL